MGVAVCGPSMKEESRRQMQKRTTGGTGQRRYHYCGAGEILSAAVRMQRHDRRRAEYHPDEITGGASVSAGMLGSPVGSRLLRRYRDQYAPNAALSNRY